MKPLLKKITAFILVFIGFAPVSFTMFLLIKQQSIRHSMKEKLEQKLLHNISVPESKVMWVKYKKEIRVDGKMFDIKSFSVENGHYHFTGLFDEEETTLNNYLEKNTEQKNERSNSILASLFQLLQSVYPGDSNDTIMQEDNSRIYCCLILSNIPSPIKNILTPPPQA
jgi:hypothetical protein